MAGYRRFVSYVYEYRNGKKDGSCGFVKAEVKAGVCHLEIKLQCPGLAPGGKCNVYGFVRKDGLMNGILFGSCITEAGRICYTAEKEAENLEGYGVGIDKLGGLLLIGENAGFWGTQWDDEIIRPENFREWKFPEKEKESDISDGQDNEKMDKKKEVEAEEYTEEKQEEAVLSPESAGQIFSEREDIADENLPDSGCRECPELSPESGMPQLTSENSIMSPSETLMADSPVMPPESGTAHAMASHGHLKPPVPPRPEPGRPMPPPVPPRPEPGRPMPPPPEPPRPEPGRPMPPPPEPPRPEPGRPLPPPAPKPSRPASDTSSGCAPFDDCEFQSCKKIRPSDCRSFCRRERGLCNNRFLLYGYESFGHILLCRTRKGKYILGVPGVYNQQERFMAGMFGFPYFKESRQINVPGGKGGYWYCFIHGPERC